MKHTTIFINQDKYKQYNASIGMTDKYFIDKKYKIAVNFLMENDDDNFQLCERLFTILSNYEYVDEIEYQIIQMYIKNKNPNLSVGDLIKINDIIYTCQGEGFSRTSLKYGYNELGFFHFFQ